MIISKAYLLIYKNDIFISHIEGIPQENGLTLKIEPREDDLDVEDFKLFLTEKLKKRGVDLNAIEILEHGYRDSLRKKKIMDSLNRSQIKFLVFDPTRY